MSRFKLTSSSVDARYRFGCRRIELTTECGSDCRARTHAGNAIVSGAGSRPPFRGQAASTDRQLFDELFARKVPEIGNGTIRIIDVVREPGHYSKVAVTATVRGINAASTCIGRRGSRIHAIEAMLAGERVSVVNFDDDPLVYVVNALEVPVHSVRVTSGAHRDIRVIVAVEQFAEAIGREGRNVRMSSELTGWRIAICTAQCTGRRHVHPRFDTTTGQSILDAPRQSGRASTEGSTPS